MFVDAEDRSVSNWLRYLNCPLHVSDENVDYSLCYGRVYIRTIKDVQPGTELLIYYSDDYAEYLGVDLDKYYDVTPPNGNETDSETHYYKGNMPAGQSVTSAEIISNFP